MCMSLGCSLMGQPQSSFSDCHCKHRKTGLDANFTNQFSLFIQEQTFIQVQEMQERGDSVGPAFLLEKSRRTKKGTGLI